MMLPLLRFLLMLGVGFLTVTFLIMAFVSSFRYKRHGSPTRKTIRVSGMYLALCTISLTLFVIILDPTRTSAMFAVLVIGLSFVVFYIGVSYFNLALVEKGPRKMLLPIWQFLKRLLTRRNSS